MKTTDGNKLIAEFMGLEQVKGNFVSFYDVYVPNLDKIDPVFNVFINDQMEDESWYVYPRFHESWDWLMPVVEKINVWCDKNGEKYNEYFWNPYGGLTDFLIFRVRNIEDLWDKVVRFIEWYNKQN